MTNKYPLIKELGLEAVVATFPAQLGSIYADAVRADDLERILENGKRSYMRSEEDWFRTHKKNDYHTHMMLELTLPITKDPTEEKLKELEAKVQGLLKEIESLK